MTHQHHVFERRPSSPWVAARRGNQVCKTVAGLLAAVFLTGLGAGATANEGDPVYFHLQPTDSTVVAGHQIGFYAEADLHPADAQYQWYRNGVAIPGAGRKYYRFIAKDADNGARYHVVAQGTPIADKIAVLPRTGPTPSRQATLAVRPAGSSFTPTLTAPGGNSLTYKSSTQDPFPTFARFGATGNDLEWSYRFDTDQPSNAWRPLGTPTLAAQGIYFSFQPPTFASKTLTVRVIDDLGVAATRTWSLGSGKPEYPVYFSAGPADATVVTGHAVGFTVFTDIDSSAQYQWYRNDVAIAGATSAAYRFTARDADNGARYHVVASGLSKSEDVLVPTESPRATLTVRPTGSALPPEIVEPAVSAVFYSSMANSKGNLQGFRGMGNNLAWSYRYAEDTAGKWRALDATTTGSQFVTILLDFDVNHASVSVRVVDDAGAAATRTWAMATNKNPTISAASVTPTVVTWPGPVSLSVTASDPEGDALSYHWYLDHAPSTPGGEAVFTPRGATSTATFTTFGNYSIYVAVTDGKGGFAERAYELVVVEPHFNVGADVNGDGEVNALDLGLVKDNFGRLVP